MKFKQLILVLILAAILLISWLIAVKSTSKADIIAAQNALVTEADALAAKELYVRAIPKYKEALTYSTDRNNEIESLLLKAYDSYGNTKSYKNLALDRIDREVAEEEEYLLTAQIYMQNNKVEDAVNILREGMKIYDSAALNDYCESIRYPYQIAASKYSVTVPTYNNDLMPARNADAWYYVSNRNQIQLGAFVEAAPFSRNGYAVVKIDGTYYCITDAGDKYGVDETGLEDVKYVYGYDGAHDYIIGKKDGKYGFYNLDFVSLSDTLKFDDISQNYDGVTAVKNNGKWGLITTDAGTITECIYDDIAFNAFGAPFTNGTAMVKQGSSWKLIGKDGIELSTTAYADAKAPEGSGFIAVADSSGKWGYINNQGELVIPYQFDDAKSFSNHLGAVCVSGSWGYINEAGTVVIDAVYDDANPFHDGAAQITAAGSPTMMFLKFYEE